MNDKTGQADNLESELADLPEKFKGKSVVDVAKAYKDLESAFSRQGQELGEYRRLATTLSETATRPSTEKQEKVPVTTDDLFADPDKAINDVIESHPVVRKARETSENLERQLAYKDFESAHPSFKEDVKDPNFLEWVGKNTSLQKLAQRADAYDFDAADQLMSLWTEKKSIKESANKMAKETIARQKQEREGTLEGASGSDSTNEVVLNRAEMRELQRKALLGDRTAQAKWNDPKFQAMRRQAYADKRVS